jgi:hypothetical protein
MDNYFNSVSPGINPFLGPAPSTAGTLVQTRSLLGYVAPYNGEVVRVSVNAAYSLSYYDGAQFDFIIMNSSNLVSGVTSWGGAYASGRQMSGWSNTFSGTTTFVAGDLIFCYVVDVNRDIWGNTLPLVADDGLFNVTLYLKFTV